MKDTTVFLVGAAAGLAVTGVAYGVFSFVVYLYADAIVSGVTLIGVGLALGCYFLRWRGALRRSLASSSGSELGSW